MNNFIDKYIIGNEHKWFWFISTVVFGAAPMIVTILINLNSADFNVFGLYKMIDLIAWGLTMCISNLNLVGSKRFDLAKGVLVALSFAGLFVFTFCLAIAQLMQQTYIYFEIMLHLFVLGSVFLSFSANKYVFVAVKK